MTDKELDRMLSSYCEAQPEAVFEYDPDRRRSKIAPLSTIRTRAAAAAGIVLISALSTTAYFVIGNKPESPAVVAPNDHNTVSETENSYTGSEAPSVIKETSPTSSATAATEQSRNTPSEPAVSPPRQQSSTASANGIVPDSPREQTAQASTEKATQAQEPIQSPTEQSTQKPVETTVPEPTVPSEAATQEPSDNADFAPTAKWVNYLSQQTLSGVIQKSLLTGDGKVYFRIYAFNGSPLGDEDLFSQGNLATVSENRYGTVIASYYLGRLEDDLEKIQKGDCLTYCFFNEDGDPVFTDIKIF